MTVMVTLEPELEAQIAKQAAMQGLSVEEYIRRILASLAAMPAPLTQQERLEHFERWLKNRPHTDAPPLSDEAISRETIYAEREDRQL